jgi:hypothetical protein
MVKLDEKINFKPERISSNTLRFFL